MCTSKDVGGDMVGVQSMGKVNDEVAFGVRDAMMHDALGPGGAELVAAIRRSRAETCHATFASNLTER